jgi:hypothetical protein
MSAEPPVQQGRRHGEALTATAAVVLFFTMAAMLAFEHSDTPPAPIDYRGPASPAPAQNWLVVPVPFVSAHLRSLPPSTTDTTTAFAPRDAYRGDGTSGVVVHDRQEIPVFDAPGGRAFAQLPAQQLSADTWLPVIGQQDGWLGTGQLSIAQQQQVRVHLGSERLHPIRDGRPAGTWTGVDRRRAHADRCGAHLSPRRNPGSAADVLPADPHPRHAQHGPGSRRQRTGHRRRPHPPDRGRITSESRLHPGPEHRVARV